MSIIYYSNFCEPSKKLLQQLAKTKLGRELHYICIDVRFKDPSGRTFVQVENQRVLLPPAITRVPALYLMESKQAIFEDSIYQFLAPKEQVVTHASTGGNMEPECFVTPRMSDSFSYWDQASDDLAAKGNGGMRQLHQFSTVEASESIPTPPENYEPDKIGKNGSKTLEEYKAERERAVAAPIARV